MANQSLQEEFYDAVNVGRPEAWRALLDKKRRTPRLPLDVDQCLLDATKLQTPAAVQDVLALRPNLNAQTDDEDGQRPIHLAAKFGPGESVRLLLRAGSMLNCADPAGLSPLHLACQHNNVATAEVLLAEGANTGSARTEHLLTPLHLAVEQGCEAIVELLLRNAADPNAKSSNSHGMLTPLGLAVKRGNVCVVRALFSAGTRLSYERDIRGDYPLHLAVGSGDADILTALLCSLGQMLPLASAGQRTSSLSLLELTDREGHTPLHRAIQKNRLDAVRLLLEAGSDVNVTVRDTGPLELAIRCVQPLAVDGEEVGFLDPDCATRRLRVAEGGHWDTAIATLLCQRGSNLEAFTASGHSPVHLALSAGLYDLATLICTKVPQAMDCADTQGLTPLHLACRHKSADPRVRLDLIRMLLDLGLSVNARSWERGNSPLSFAISDGNIDVISLLLERTPDLSGVDVEGMSALHDAVLVESVAAVQLLVGAGAGVDQGDRDSAQTPLILAATLGALDVAQCLLDLGADLHCQETRLGYSAIHRAINNFYRDPDRYLQMMSLLVMGGCDLTQTDIAGLTPLQMMLSMMVCRSGEAQVVQRGLAAVKLLVEAGSNLQPWAKTAIGVLRRTPLLSLTFTGQYRTVYYLANMGWPLTTEVPPPSPSPPMLDADRHVQPDWMHLPGKTHEQDALHAYLLLRLANPFSLRDLCRNAVRTCVKQTTKVRRGDGRERQIVSCMEDLPVPAVVRSYVSLRDRDHSCAQECWGKLLHLLPEGAYEAVTSLSQGGGGGET